MKYFDKILPWIPLFGGIYCNLADPVRYFGTIRVQTINFIYQLLCAVISHLIIYLTSPK